MTSLFRSREALLALAIFGMTLGIAFRFPAFVTPNNLANVFNDTAPLMILAIGQMVVILTKCIDLSVAANLALSGMVAALLNGAGLPLPLILLAVVVLGAGLGAVNGLLVWKVGIPSIVVTLGMLSILKGGLISATGGSWITDMPPGFMIAQMRLFNIPSAVYFMVVLTIAAALFMRYTDFGRAVYAVGGNIEAARAAGINPERIVIGVFALHGLFAGIAGILFATQLQVIQSTVPPNLELTVITASVIGGVSILGGTGTVIGSTLAAILFACIGSALIFLNVSAYWLRAVLGLLILATVLADMIRRRRSK